MKILVVFPVLLFVILIGWIGISEWRLSETESFLSNESLEEETTALESSKEKMEQETESETTKAPELSKVHLLFAGDIYLSDHVIAAYNDKGSIDGVLDQAFQEEISRSDIFMANQEFPFSERGTPAPDKQFTFRLPTSKVSMMNEIGVDIVTIANNHTLDYGRDALVDTCSVLDEAGIRYVGAGADMERAKQLQTMEVDDKIIGFLAASRVYPDASWQAGSKTPGMVSGYDPTILLEEVTKAREICDYLVVYVHWGIERDEKPQEYQRILGMKIIDAGADLVVGSHPHVLQGLEYYKGKPICYSLGNYMFGSSIPKTALLCVNVDFEQGDATLSFIPGTSSGGYTRTLEKEEEKREFYRYIEEISFGVSVDDYGVIHN